MKVLCIDASDSSTWLEEGEEYTVIGRCNRGGYCLKETSSLIWNANRFVIMEPETKKTTSFYCCFVEGSTKPITVQHFSLETAREEAARLATFNLGRKVYVLQPIEGYVNEPKITRLSNL